MSILKAIDHIDAVDISTPIITSFIESRIILLKKLNSILKMMNDELAYMTWIELVPDEATIADYESIAEDDKAFEEVLNEFQTLFAFYKYAE